jgi:hypothetical protein
LCFNTSDVVGRVHAGNLTETVVRDNPVAAAKCVSHGFPLGTRSQFVIYRDGIAEVARAHRYLLPNGQIGASGKPDPKRMICCGVIFFL